MKRYSPAKVNLFLQVLGKRRDGYHDLATLMQQVSLCDEMEFSLRGEGIRVRCPGSPFLENDGNIVYRAARAILPANAGSKGIEITLRKNIPVAAGLGGGSSNAATTLYALNELLGLSLDRKDLIRIGATIGADVPFFLYGSKAWAFGIGDRLEEVEDVPSLWFVLVNPGIEISTKTVYEGLNLGLTKESIKFSIQKFQSVEDMAWGLRNDLEEVAFRLHPVLADLKKLLKERGALGSLMSGSGSTVYGIFPAEEEARRAADALKREGPWSVFTVHSL